MQWKKLILVFAITLFLFLMAWYLIMIQSIVPQIVYRPNGRPSHVRNQLIVGFKDGIPKDEVNQIADRVGAREELITEGLDTYVFSFSSFWEINYDEIISKLESYPEVENADKNRVVTTPGN